MTAYVVEYRDAAQTSAQFQSREFPPSPLSGSLDGLVPFVNYEVRVRGENIAGQSGPSNNLRATTHPAGKERCQFCLECLLRTMLLLSIPSLFPLPPSLHLCLPPFSLLSAPPAPSSFSVSGFTSSSLTLTWSRPSPLNGQFAAYRLFFAPEASFATSPTTEFLFSTQYTITRTQVGVVYRVELQVGTRSLSGSTLWGPFAVLRVRDGMKMVVQPHQHYCTVCLSVCLQEWSWRSPLPLWK